MSIKKMTEEIKEIIKSNYDYNKMKKNHISLKQELLDDVLLVELDDLAKQIDLLSEIIITRRILGN